MPAIFILGLVFVVGLFAFYLFSTSGNAEKNDKPKEKNNLKKKKM